MHSFAHQVRLFHDWELDYRGDLFSKEAMITPWKAPIIPAIVAKTIENISKVDA